MNKKYIIRVGLMALALCAGLTSFAQRQGIGSSQPGVRSYTLVDGKLQELPGSPVKVENFGNTGYFGTYTYAAQISNPYVMRIDNTGAGSNITLALPTYAIDEVNPAVDNLIDRGDGTLAMVLYYSNRDSACMATPFMTFTDSDLLKSIKIIK